MKKKNVKTDGLNDMDIGVIFGSNGNNESSDCMLSWEQLFSEKDALSDFSRVCEAVDRKGLAVIIKNDELRYAVIDFSEYQRLAARSANNYNESTLKAFETEEKKVVDATSMTKADPIIEDVVRFVASLEGVSTSVLQRRFNLGYGRAARIIDYLEAHGIISAYNGSKPREVLINENGLEEALKMLK